MILHGVEKTTSAQFLYSSMTGSPAHIDLIEIEGILRAMPAPERKVLLSWAQGLSTREAAEYLNIMPSTFRKRRSRAVHKLMEELTDVDS